MFTGEIFEYYDGKCQASGKITTSTAMKRFAGLLIAVSIPLAFLFNVILYHISLFFEVLPFMPENFSLNELFTFVGALVVLIAIAIMCFAIDKRKVRAVTDYLHEFLRLEESDDD